MDAILNILGTWTWWIVAGIMFVAELIAPAFIFLWFGVAAILTAVLHMFIDMNWQWQLSVFAVFSVLLLILSRFIVSNRQVESDQPLLNRRHEALIGREFVLDTPIVNGRGRVRVADSVWQVEGADLAAGEKVRVTGAKGSLLVVEPVSGA
ncbi:MAG: hypothetical protein C0605_12085 [Hyphomicrobiales bacterium]|nr:MAG: hypothetical protein C0605_12085 [Hyphomicrobiales bacterium]